jgi:hypothetical protein
MVQTTKLAAVVFSCGDLLYDSVSISDYSSTGRMAGE